MRPQGKYKAKLGYRGGTLYSYPNESKVEFTERAKKIAFLLDKESINIEDNE